MIGIWINAAGIFIGGLAAWMTGRNLSSAAQLHCRQVLTALTIFVSGIVAWAGLTGPWDHGLKQLGIAFMALCGGSLIGHLLGFQRRLGQLLRWASATSPGPQTAPEAGTFASLAVIFALNPLGILGAALAGWTGDWRALALKGGLDAVAALGFVVAGHRTVMLAILPMVAVQGSLQLLASALAVRYPNPELAQSLQVISGLLILVMAPVVFGWRRVPLANYLPALVLAPLLTALWR